MWVRRLLRLNPTPVRPDLTRALQAEVDRLQQITNELKQVTEKLTATVEDDDA